MNRNQRSSIHDTGRRGEISTEPLPSVLFFPGEEKQTPWRTVGPINDDFADCSRTLICDASNYVSNRIFIGQAPPRRALIIGAGKCIEIPLRFLSDRFEHLIVTDIDRPRLEAGLKHEIGEPKSRNDLRCKIDIVIGDIMGVDNAVNSQIRQLFASATQQSHTAMMARLGCILTEVEIQPHQFDGPFDLVVASCVLSQLHHGIADTAEQCFRQHGRGEISVEAMNQWQCLIKPFVHSLQVAFLESCCNWLRPGGVLYLSATPRVNLWEYSDKSSESRWQSRIIRRMLVGESLDEMIDSLPVDVEQTETFQWPERTPRKEGDVIKPGFLFDVEAMILRKRDANTI